MDRRAFLLAASSMALAPRAYAQNFNFEAASRYSAERRGVALLVMHEGRIVFENYPSPGGVDRGWELASGTKSFCGVMAAAAVQDGLLSLDEPVFETIREWRNDSAKRRISIRHILSLTSGLDAGRMFRPPTYEAALQTPVAHEPGQVFQYGPAPFQIFGEIMRRKSPRDRDPVDYLQRRVFSRLNIAPTEWRRGADDLPFMPQGAHFTARGWARFGEFVLQDGMGFVDRAALRQCFVPTRANPGYGLTWWLLRPGLVPPGRGAGVEISPENFARLGIVNMAAGAGDQRLYLMPERGLVVARQANRIFRSFRERGDEDWNDAVFLRLLLNA